MRLNIMDQKKLKQVNISLTEDDYLILKTIALYERRSISDIARLILVDNALLLFKEKYNNDFKKAHFIPHMYDDLIKN